MVRGGEGGGGRRRALRHEHGLPDLHLPRRGGRARLEGRPGLGHRPQVQGVPVAPERPDLPVHDGVPRELASHPPSTGPAKWS